MGKLGKKARKFAKKNLQSVLKRKRKLKSMFKKKVAKSEHSVPYDRLHLFSFLCEDELREAEDPEGDKTQLHDGSKKSDYWLIFKIGDPEFSNFWIATRTVSRYPWMKKMMLNGFTLFYVEISDEDESSDDGRELVNENGTATEMSMLLYTSAVDSLRHLVTEQQNVSAFTRLLNGYRAACHYGTESSNVLKDDLTFSKILMFVLHEADNIFRKLLGIQCSNERKDVILELKDTAKWKKLKPLIKSYLRSTLFFLNEVSDSEILAFTLTRLKASIIFFAAFPHLLQRLIKEAVKKICSWQYANCIELWIAFISVNIHDYDLQPLLYMIIQIINGVAVLFPGPRYLPLRVKCVQWLNHLSSSSGVFIPVASLALDVLEYKIGKGGSKPGKDFNFSSAIKLPKHWLKSGNFQEECVFSAIELLAVHFAQWSYHISFPELATIPVICLRKFHEMTTTESSQRLVKRFIDQVEQNIEFVRKRRDEVAFSPRDQQSVESFLQLEKGSGNVPFTQYYRSVIEKSASRNLPTKKNTRCSLT
ncbi:hypothetical protein GH714_034401 [Hevea brasiliensis]|uniref:Nucleolar complex protein 2 homolog n=1 Tax=Hevea brasiliensis TaxID=3981 RepID=A0A6A6L343_HEVBR|nr:hypothetical protein GH714_034401 [Hevea brasiliensis]